jgi:hypothetical protein
MEEQLIIPERYRYIGVFTTFRCNLHCSFCLNEFDKKFRRLSEYEKGAEEWVAGLNRIESRSDVPITFSGGEVFIRDDFIWLINNLRPDLAIDLLTNLYPSSSTHRKRLERFLEEVKPERLKRNSPYPSIRVSYHPEQMESDLLLGMVKEFQDRGFSIGIYSVQYPSPAQLEKITQMQFKCAKEGILFRVKDFTGKYEGTDDLGRPFSITHGDYSKYPSSTFQEVKSECSCRTSELLVGPDCKIYRCHRDLFAMDSPIGDIRDSSFQIEDIFRQCRNYGQCHPCDVKVKTDSRQQLGHTSVEIKDIESKG